MRSSVEKNKPIGGPLSDTFVYTLASLIARSDTTRGVVRILARVPLEALHRDFDSRFHPPSPSFPKRALVGRSSPRSWKSREKRPEERAARIHAIRVAPPPSTIPFTLFPCPSAAVHPLFRRTTTVGLRF